jgi:malonyl-CoA O-methyltransferase
MSRELEKIEPEKLKIAQSFGQAAATYHTQAALQQDCAAKLLALLDGWDVPAGEILEIGCGTGFLTQGLCDRFPCHPFQVTDLSAEMLHFCQKHLQIARDRVPVSFWQLDGERLEPEQRYSLIIANFVIQWFNQPVETLQLWLDCLKPNGILCLAFPTCHSFPEWRQQCEFLQIPFTANALPNPLTLKESLSNRCQNLSLQEEVFCTTHGGAIDFFRGLKAIGAGVNTRERSIAASELKRLIQHWDDSVKQNQDSILHAHHHVAFLLIQR